MDETSNTSNGRFAGLKWIAFSILIIIILLFFFKNFTEEETLGDIDMLALGITAYDLEGTPRPLDSLKGKVILLNFWATWCAPCRAEIPDFNELQQTYEKDGFTMVAISMDTTGINSVRDFAETVGIDFPVWYAGDQAELIVAKVGGLAGVPTSFLIDRNGRLVQKQTGVRPISFWKKNIEELL